MRNCALQSVFAPKKRLLLLIILCFITSFSDAQNLIPNGGFEGTMGSEAVYPVAPSGSTSPGQYAIVTDPATANSANFASFTNGSKMMVVDSQTGGSSSGYTPFLKYVNLPLQAGVDY